MTYGAIRGSAELRQNIAALYSEDEDDADADADADALTPDEVLVTLGANRSESPRVLRARRARGPRRVRVPDVPAAVHDPGDAGRRGLAVEAEGRGRVRARHGRARGIAPKQHQGTGVFFLSFFFFFLRARPHFSPHLSLISISIPFHFR